MTPQRLLVFGASSAIAQECQRSFVKRGWSVFCVARNPDKLAAVLADLRVRAGPNQIVDGTAADLLDVAGHPALFEAARTALGDVDAVLVAYGTLPDQAACQASVTRTLTAIAENATSVVSLLTLAANYFEGRGRGVLAAISSVAGDRGRQSNYVYGASKSLVTTILQGLRNRLAPAGVRVVTIKPGFVDTPMTAHVADKGALWASPATVAKSIVRAIENGRPDVVYTPWIWYWIMMAIRLIPDPIFKRLKL